MPDDKVLTKEQVDELIKVETEKAIRETEERVKSEVAGTLKKDIENRDKQINELKDELQTVRDILEDDDDKKNWASARLAEKELKGKIKELEESNKKSGEEFSKEIRKLRTSITEEKVDGMMEALAGEDKELKDKLKFHFNRLGGESDDGKETQERIKDAYMLATGKRAPNMLNVVRGHSGQPPKEKEATSQELVDMGKAFGVTEDEINKYSKKAQQKKPNRLS